MELLMYGLWNYSGALHAHVASCVESIMTRLTVSNFTRDENKALHSVRRYFELSWHWIIRIDIRSCQGEIHKKFQIKPHNKNSEFVH